MATSNLLDELIGKTLISVAQRDSVLDPLNDELVLSTIDADYILYHEQDCCESVVIEEIIGNLDKLVGSPIRMAREVSSVQTETDNGSATWTFYNFATARGDYVTVRWCGESNGFYSEAVDCRKELTNRWGKVDVIDDWKKEYPI